MIRPCPKPVKREAKPRKALKRSWIRRRRPRRLSKAGSDPKYLAWLHTQPCVGKRFTGGRGSLGHWCATDVQASHLRHHTGLGLKEPDRNAVTMCRDLHEQWEQHKGWFAGWSNLERFAWFTRAIAETQRAWEAR